MQKKLLNIDSPVGDLLIPYLQIGDEKEKKKIFISGGLHGDEVNGIEAVRVVLENLQVLQKSEKFDGCIYLFPVLNPWGFDKGVRINPLDKKDLNRQFGKDPINSEESLSSLIISKLTEEIFSKCSVGIDFHDAGYGARLLPHVRIHKSDEDGCISCTRELASLFGTDFILEREGRSSMLAVNLNNEYDTPVITVEIGGSKTIDPFLENIAVRGVNNILISSSIIQGEIDLPEKTYVIKKRIALNSKFAGVIHFEEELGAKIEEGDLIAVLYDPIQSREIEILSPKSGVVFSIWPNNLISKGGAICTIVCLTDEDSIDTVELDSYTVKPFDL